MCMGFTGYECEVSVRKDLLFFKHYKTRRSISPFYDRKNKQEYIFKVNIDKKILKRKINDSDFPNVKSIVEIVQDLIVLRRENGKSTEVSFSEVKEIFINYVQNEILELKRLIDGEYKRFIILEILSAFKELGNEYKETNLVFYFEGEEPKEIDSEIKLKIALENNECYTTIPEGSELYKKVSHLIPKRYNLNFRTWDNQPLKGIFEVEWSLKMNGILCECFKPLRFHVFDLFTVNKDFSNLKEKMYAAHELHASFSFFYNGEVYSVVGVHEEYRKHLPDISDYRVDNKKWKQYIVKGSERHFEIDDSCKEVAKVFRQAMNENLEKQIFSDSWKIEKIILDTEFKLIYNEKYK